MKKLYTLLFCSIFAQQLFAEQEKALGAEIELGVIATSGNTNTESYKGKINVKHELSHWRNQYIVEGLFKRDEIENEGGDQEKQTTAEKYFASAQADYKLSSEYSALFLYAEYDRNRFSGFDYQTTLALGYSNRLFSTDNSYMSYDIGPGYTLDQPETPEGETKPDSEDTFIVRAAAEYVYEFSENARFTQTLSSNFSPDSDKNTKTKSVTAITAKINSSLALRASFTIDYNSLVPDEREHADTETAITLVYNL